jgi:hypothetical protein
MVLPTGTALDEVDPAIISSIVRVAVEGSSELRPALERQPSSTPAARVTS